MRATVVILTKLPGVLPVKTRLWPALGEKQATALYREMVRSTVVLARRFCEGPVIAYSPPDADAEAALPGLAPCRFLPVHGADGAACLEEALFACAWELPLVALGGDAPDLPPERLEEALAVLEEVAAAVVPTPDGGFSALALRAPVAGLSQAFRYGGSNALEALISFLEGRALRVRVLAPWRDIDRPEDLQD